MTTSQKKEKQLQKRKVVDLLKEQELIRAKYFVETEQPFILENLEKEKATYLSNQIQEHYKEVLEALKRYMEIEDELQFFYANTYIEVMGWRFRVATGLQLLEDINQVKRDPFSGNYRVNSHPMGVFLSMCSVPCKYEYAREPRNLLDPLNLEGDTVIEDVSYKTEEFLIQLKYAIEKVKYEMEVEESR